MFYIPESFNISYMNINFIQDGLLPVRLSSLGPMSVILERERKTAVSTKKGWGECRPNSL